MMKIGILGGGLTGLTLGNFLGKSAEILEKNPEAGGLCRSLCESGFTFDYGGSHIVFSRDEEVLRFMTGLLKDNANRVRRNTKVLFRGRYVKYPFENGLNDLPFSDNASCLFHYLANYAGKRLGLGGSPKNFEEWVYWNFGKGIAERYMLPYNEKVWNAKGKEMGLEWVAGRVPEPPVIDVLKSSLGFETEGYSHQLYFYYPKIGGIQALPKELERRAEAKVTKGFGVKKIRPEGKGWVVSNGTKDKVFDRIVSTIHISDLANSLSGVPREVKDAVGGFRHNSLVTVMVGLKTRKINDFSWLYIPDKDVMANRISFPSNFSPNAAPEGKSSVLAEITCVEKDEVWRKSDGDLASETIDDMHKLGIIDRKDVCYSGVRRTKYAYVVYDLDYAKNIKIARDYFKQLGIDLCGRFSEFEYLNMDACIRRAMNKAKEMGGTA